LLLSPDHVGTQVPVLLTLLIIDRAPQHWYVAAGVGVLLALAEMTDTTVVYLAVIPLVIVCALRAQRLAAQWYDLALAAAAIASVGLARLCVALIQHYGGYGAATPHAVFAPFYSVPGHFWITVGGVLQLYGAYFFGQPVGLPAIGALLHLVGLGLAGWAVVLAARRLFRETDRIVGVLALALLANLLAYVLSTNVTSLASTRDIAAVLPIGAILAGRLLAGRLSQAWLPLTAVLLGYAVCLGAGIAQPSVPGDNQLLVTWLGAHHLSYGLAGYWQASSVTLESSGRVQVRPFTVRARRVVPGPWELKATWYDAGLNRANFVILFHGGPDMSPFAPAAQVLATFGPAARSYQTGPYQILVWDKNLLTEMRRG
jgi:hypothetical protein